MVASKLDKYHWMHGLEEYMSFINHIHLDQYKRIQKAIQYGEPWPIRDLMLHEISRGKKSDSEEFVNIIMANHLAEMEYNNEQMLRYILTHVDDGFLMDVHAWVAKWGDRTDLDDHFSRGQIKSKLWMMEELRNIVDGNDLGTVLLYGGWYATISHFFFKFFSPSKLYSIDIDPETVEIADDFNKRQSYMNNWQFKAFAKDVGTIQYSKDGKCILPTDIEKFGTSQLSIKPTVVVNTSCEHMNDDWFYNLPDGQFVVLQTNNYFDNPQHVNCVRSVTEARKKYKFSEIYYSGELETFLYNRYMIIGIK